MKTEYIELLSAIVNFSSINKAAEELHYPPQKLGNIVKRIEREFNIQIFNRTPKGVTLTACGKEFMDKAREIANIVAKMQEIQLKNNAHSLNITGTINIYEQFALNDKKRGIWLSKFAKQFPNISLNIIETNFADTIKNVRSNPNNIGLVVSTASSNIKEKLQDDLILYTLYTDRIHIIFAKNSPILNPNIKSLALSSIIEKPLLIFENKIDNNSTIPVLLSSFGTPNIKYCTSNFNVFSQLLLKGDCIAIGNFSNEDLQFNYPDLVSIPIQDDIKFEIILVANKNTQPDSIVNYLINFSLQMYNVQI